MTDASALLTARSEFDDFLFASIGEETNGMVLSVISALVRLNVDPWQEAAKLATLPVDKATQSLGGLLAKLPEGTFVGVDAKTIAAGLVARLPRARNLIISSPAAALGVRSIANPRALAAALIVAAVILLGTMTYLLFHHERSSLSDAAPSVIAAFAVLAYSA